MVLRCGVGEVHMNKGRVGEERGGKETDGCPLTPSSHSISILCTLWVLITDQIYYQGDLIKIEMIKKKMMN
jgi:hypothetical protein